VLIESLLEYGSLSNVKQGLERVESGVEEMNARRTPSLWNPLLRYNLSPTASRKSTDKSIRAGHHWQNEGEMVFRTFARHINYHIDVDVQKARGSIINTKLIIWPAPDKLCDVICDEEKGNKSNEKSEDSTLT
jgi:hypothetical protein